MILIYAPEAHVDRDGEVPSTREHGFFVHEVTRYGDVRGLDAGPARL